MIGVKDIVDWGVAGGHTSYGEFKHEIRARARDEAKRLVDAGVSQRQAAKMTGVPRTTIQEDMAENRPQVAENRPDGDLDPPSTKAKPSRVISPGTFATIVIDPPWPMAKIERDVRPNAKRRSCWG